MARLYACKCEYHLTCDNCETKLPRLFYKYSELDEDEKYKFCPHCGEEIEEVIFDTEPLET